VPDATTLLNLHHLLEKHELGAAIFARVGERLLANGLKLSGGTIVDATIIATPSSTKNEGKVRDPKMHSTSKGGHWHFGMKAHIGVDSASGIVHSASVSAANEHDSQQLSNLLHGDKTRLYGDSTYANQKEALKAKDFTNTRAYRTKSQTRAKVEHPFLTLKRIWGNAQSVLP
jgi:transposase, IS5 family